MRPASTFFLKKNFKIGSHNTIHTFKNYFTTVFLILSNKQYPNRYFSPVVDQTWDASEE